MTDRLAFLLSRFDLQARVFHTGPLCQNIWFDAADGVGHLHLLRSGTLDIETGAARLLRIETPAMILYPAPTGHRMIPLGETGCDLVCATLDFGARTRNPLIRSLPGMVVIRLEDMPSLGTSLGLLFDEVMNPKCGRQALLDRLSEVVVIQTLRHVIDQGLVRDGVLAGLAMLGAGEFARRHPGRVPVQADYIPAVVTGAGFLTLFASVYSAYGLYDLIPPIAAFVLLAMNGFFVLAEFAAVKMRPSRVDALIAGGNSRAKLVKHVQTKLDDFLSVCQVGITFCTIGLGFVAATAVVKLIEPIVLWTGIAPDAFGTSITSHGIAFVIAYLLVSFLHILIGELVPKSMAIRITEPAALWTARPLIFFY